MGSMGQGPFVRGLSRTRESPVRRSPWDSAAIKRRLDLSRPTPSPQPALAPNPTAPAPLPLRLAPLRFLPHTSPPPPSPARSPGGASERGEASAMSLRVLNPNAEVLNKSAALHMNINAAKGLQDVLKTNLGPKGTIKM